MQPEELYQRFKQCGHVSTDSRAIASFREAGKPVIFFALKGERFDGNRYALQALTDGAAYAVTDDPSLEEDPRLIRVEDSLQTLQQLAAYHRRQLTIPVLSVTGSNGKTTSKELIRAVLSEKYRCYATEGNLNNHIGVPLSLLRIPADTEIAVIEMGANHLREIELLAGLARPDYGLITNIGKAHLEGFGGPEGIKRGKGELFDSLVATGGTAFWLRESDALKEMVTQRKSLKNIPYDRKILNMNPLPGTGDYLSVQWNGERLDTQLVGEYNLFNLMAAVAVGSYFGVEEAAIRRALSGYAPGNSRSQLIVAGTNRIVADAYNANPSSMKASLENFARLGGTGKTAILGDMKELGAYSLREHTEILKQLNGMDLEEVLLVGGNMREALACEPLRMPHRWFADSEEAVAYLRNSVPRNRLVLIKGSNSTKLSRVSDFFIAL